MSILDYLALWLSRWFKPKERDVRFGFVPRYVMLAYRGCSELEGLDLSTFPKSIRDAVIMAALDGELEGEDKAMQAAADTLMSLVLAGEVRRCR